MSYRQEMDAVGRHVSAVLGRDERLVGRDLDAAVVGFNATTALLRTVHHDLIGPRGFRIRKELQEAERRPAHLLARMLDELPRLDQPAPTDVQANPVTGVAARHWQEAARSATLAEHSWITADPRTRPTGPAARGELTQVASLTEALAVAGADLSTDLRNAGRHGEAGRLRQATTTGLRVAAAAARWDAMRDAGPPADVQPVASHRVLALRRPSHLPAGLHRLAVLLDTAGHISPQHVQLIARATASAALASSQVLRAAGQGRVAAALAEHAERLADVAAGRLAASIIPPDPRPLAQAQEVHRVLARSGSPSASLTPSEAVAVAQAVPLVSRALVTAADRQIAERQWLAATGQLDAGQPRWLPAHGVVPVLSARLEAVASDADRLPAVRKRRAVPQPHATRGKQHAPASASPAPVRTITAPRPSTPSRAGRARR